MAAEAVAVAERALLPVPWVAAEAAVKDRVASWGQVDKAMPVVQPVVQHATTAATPVVRLPPAGVVVQLLLVESAPGAVH